MIAKPAKVCFVIRKQNEGQADPKGDIFHERIASAHALIPVSAIEEVVADVEYVLESRLLTCQ